MAKRTIVTTIDDVDGQPIEEGGRTVTFALDGTAYEIDLSDEHAAEFEQSLSPYIAAARKVTGKRRRR